MLKIIHHILLNTVKNMQTILCVVLSIDNYKYFGFWALKCAQKSGEPHTGCVRSCFSWRNKIGLLLEKTIFKISWNHFLFQRFLRCFKCIYCEKNTCGFDDVCGFSPSFWSSCWVEQELSAVEWFMLQLAYRRRWSSPDYRTLTHTNSVMV